MKKSTVRVTVVMILLAVGLVGVYAFMAGKRRAAADAAVLSATELVLAKDLERDYPPTPKEVIKAYAEIEKCFYNEDCSEEEIEQLGMKARELYDAELLEANEVGSYLDRLKTEIKEFKEGNKRLTGVNVAASANVDIFTEDGYQFARIYCGYTIVDGTGSTNTGMVYLLRRDEERHWKIYGWDLSTKVNPQND